MGTTISCELRSALEELKISCLSRGIRVTPPAMAALTGEQGPTLTLHEYPTTGGLTLELPCEVYVNAPFDEPFCEEAEVWLEIDGTNGFALRRRGTWVPVVRVLPLPGFLSQTDSKGRPITLVAMSHADRVRISPLLGCAYDCGFCDFPGLPYEIRPLEQLAEAMHLAEQDQTLPTRHVLISGGSPRKRHYEVFEEIVCGLARSSSMPVDLMMSPMIGNLDFIDRVVDAGIAGFSINVELYSREAGLAVLGMKYRTSRGMFDQTVARAVGLLGATGRVRSLIIPGLEPLEETLAGVEALARLGCSPTLSPFRPALGTRLVGEAPPSYDFLRRTLEESRELAARNGVHLGPSCLPCQHNTLSFPWDVQ